LGSTQGHCHKFVFGDFKWRLTWVITESQRSMDGRRHVAGMQGLSMRACDYTAVAVSSLVSKSIGTATATSK